jgi:zinc transporter 2
MADAAHMFSDFASFGVSLFVIWLSGRKPKKTMTYGFYRAEALGALATVVIIWYVTGILAYLAVERIHTGQFEIQVAAVLFSTIVIIWDIIGSSSGMLRGHPGIR